MCFRIGLAAVVGLLTMLGCGEDDLASVQFCHAIWKNQQTIVMKAVVGKGDSKTVFKANTECCTNCAGVVSGRETAVVLYEGDKEVYRTTTTFKKKNDYVLLATVFEGATTPSLGLSDLTRDHAECATHLPAGWDRCGHAQMSIIPVPDENWDFDDKTEGDRDAGCIEMSCSTTHETAVMPI